MLRLAVDDIDCVANDVGKIVTVALSVMLIDGVDDDDNVGTREGGRLADGLMVQVRVACLLADALAPNEADEASEMEGDVDGDAEVDAEIDAEDEHESDADVD